MLLILCMLLRPTLFCPVPSPIKIMAWSLRMDQRLFAVPFTIMLVSLIATQFADIMYFSVRIFFSSIISIFFNKVCQLSECAYQVHQW